MIVQDIALSTALSPFVDNNEIPRKLSACYGSAILLSKIRILLLDKQDIPLAIVAIITFAPRYCSIISLCRPFRGRRERPFGAVENKSVNRIV